LLFIIWTKFADNRKPWQVAKAKKSPKSRIFTPKPARAGKWPGHWAAIGEAGLSPARPPP